MVRRILAVVVIAAFTLGAGSLLAKAKTYQFTGEVQKVEKGSFTVKKGTEVWEFEAGSEAKGADGLKVGDKVTVKYRMVATDVQKK
jgi:hypothetical protein